MFIFYRAILYEGGSFSKYNSSFYTIFFLGAFFLACLQAFVFFGNKFQEYSKEVNVLIVLIRILYFLILINVNDMQDSVPGIMICIFLSSISLPLIRLDILFFTGLVVIIVIIFREFNLISNQQTAYNDLTITALSAAHITLGHIEIVFVSFLSFLLQKRNVNISQIKSEFPMMFLLTIIFLKIICFLLSKVRRNRKEELLS